MYSGDFWTEDRVKEWKRDKRRCEHLSQWPVFESAIASPISASPWHAQLEDQAAATQVQDGIDASTTARSVSLSWGAREVGSPCEWRGGARHCSRAMVGESGLETC